MRTCAQRVAPGGISGSFKAVSKTMLADLPKIGHQPNGVGNIHHPIRIRTISNEYRPFPAIALPRIKVGGIVPQIHSLKQFGACGHLQPSLSVPWWGHAI